MEHFDERFVTDLPPSYRWSIRPEKRAGVTQRDLAHALKLSLGTVSMALKDDPRLLASTREAVQRLACELDYRVNERARALSLLKSTRLSGVGGEKQ